MFRLDRFLTLHAFRHLMRVYPQSKGIRIPILMYHSISDEPEKGHPYYWINTSPKLFAEQMQFLHDNKYKVISLEEACSALNSNLQPATRNPQPVTDNLVVLTFDDGYLDFYTDAFPALQRFGYTATIFLPTAFIGNSKPGLAGKKHLDWGHVRELKQQGISFGSHTVNHRQLWKCEDSVLESELRESRKTIEEKAGEGVETFCYPYWFPEQDKIFVVRIKELLRNCGYLCGTGTRIGTIHQPGEKMVLKRIPLNSADDLCLFSEKLSGNYDWLQIIQRAYKMFKTRKIDTI
ncbi:MAG: hypothetical protein FJ115_00235 [Deltaproteobacteria bacterium]|nr:hypothetical protein [Deltaproteobacteria bacterium]MBM4321957.1 hypothetical protein [Deltaproteobacteria bacterium]